MGVPLLEYLKDLKSLRLLEKRVAIRGMIKDHRHQMHLNGEVNFLKSSNEAMEKAKPKHTMITTLI